MDTRGRILQLIETQGLKIQSVSKGAGLGQTTLRNYLDNPDRAITDRSLRKIADYLGVSLDYLLRGPAIPNEEAAALWARLSEDERRGVIAYMQTVIEARAKNWTSIYSGSPRKVAEEQSKFNRNAATDSKRREG